MAHATVSPARIRYWSETDISWVIHGYGWQATYPDGTKGPVRKTRAEAQADAKAWKSGGEAA